jgi:O-Antigen ligase
VTWTTLGAPGSSLGSPTFLAGYLVIVAPFALYRVIGRARSATTGGARAAVAYAGWLTLLLIVCAVTVDATIRGPMLGLATGMLTFAVLAAQRWGSSRPARGDHRALKVAGAVALVLVGAAATVAATGGTGILGLQRFLKIAQGSDSSVERLTVWQDALRIPLGEPLRLFFGFGLETQSAVLEHGEATVRLTQNQQWDRAHDLLLDTWLTGGLLGVAILLVVLGCAVRSAWRARASTPGSLLAVAVLAALAGHLVEVSFAFHTVVTGALFWLLLGLAASLTPRYARSPTRDVQRRQRFVLAAFTGVAGLLLLPLVATPAVADALYGDARRANYDVGAQQEELAARWAPWVEELPRAAALDWQQVATRRGDPVARGRVETDLRAAAARAPAEPLPQLRLTRFYLAQGNLDAADQACQRALLTGPYRATVWDTCADVSARRGLSDEAPLRRARGEDLRHPL